MFYNYFTVHRIHESDISDKFHQYAKSEGIEGVRPSYVTESNIEESYRSVMRKRNKRK